MGKRENTQKNSKEKNNSYIRTDDPKRLLRAFFYFYNLFKNNGLYEY